MFGYTAAEAHVHADALGDTFTDEMVTRIEERLGAGDDFVFDIGKVAHIVVYAVLGLLIARASIWRMRSRVRLKCSPTSSSVRGSPRSRPKRRRSSSWRSNATRGKDTCSARPPRSRGCWRGFSAPATPRQLLSSAAAPAERGLT